jgi:mRNA-degrading endonuclease RelE of RelBE toxin-antitoxin system
MKTISFICPEFDKDLKHLCKKYPSLEKEFPILKKSLEVDPLGSTHTFRIDQLGEDIFLPVYKLKKMACRSLQNPNKLRLIYAYDDTKQEIQFIQFLEIYAKNEQVLEDRARIEKYLKGKKSLSEE